MTNGELGQIARYGGIYAVASLVNGGAGLILIPLYTHTLSPSQFGIYAMILAVSEIVGLLCGAGIAKAMGRYYFDYVADPVAQARVVSTTLLGFLGIAVLMAAGAYPLASLLVSIIFQGPEFAALFALAIITVIFSILFEIENGYLVIRKLARSYLLLACAKAAFLLGTNAYLVFHLGLGVWGIVISMAITLGVLSMILMAVLLVHNGVSFSWALFKRLLVFGIPLVPPAFAHAGIALTQRYLLISLESIAAAGIYALADRLASVLQMFVAGPFSQIFFVRRFESMTLGADQQVFREILLIFVAVMMISVLALSLFAREVVALIAPPEYLDAARLMPWLGLCYVLAALNLNIELGIVYEKNTWVISAIAGVTLVLTFVASAFFIMREALLGAALAYVLVSVVRLLATVWANRRYGNPLVSLEWVRAAAILAVGTALGLIGVSLATPESGLVAFGARVALFAGFIALLTCTPLIGKDARLLIGSLWRRHS